MSRRKDRDNIIENEHPLYQKKISDRGLKKIIHYATPKLNPVTLSDYAELRVTQEVWKRGDRMYKYAHKHYGNSRYWWVIAWFNSRPTDAHYRVGEVFSVPLPLEEVLQKFND